jgi:SAM-dependent methyltransferase
MTHGTPSWFETTLGQLVLERESEFLTRCTRRFHGDTMLWLGPVAPQPCDLGRCMVRTRLFGLPPGCDLEAKRASADGGVYVGEIGALPFRSADLDAVVVHHGLEQSKDPRAAIREVARVVRPGGWLLICGFNPMSSFGLRHFVSRLGRRRFGKLKFISPFRVSDWLAVLDCEIDGRVNYMIYRLPLDANRRGHPRWRRLGNALESWGVPFGGVYVIMARKRAMRLTGSESLARGRARFNLVPMPNPTPSQRTRTRVRQTS